MTDRKGHNVSLEVYISHRRAIKVDARFITGQLARFRQKHGIESITIVDGPTLSDILESMKFFHGDDSEGGVRFAFNVASSERPLIGRIEHDLVPIGFCYDGKDSNWVWLTVNFPTIKGLKIDMKYNVVTSTGFVVQ